MPDPNPIGAEKPPAGTVRQFPGRGGVSAGPCYRPNVNPVPSGQPPAPVPSAVPPPPLLDPTEPKIGEPAPVHTLSPEEQMARFEKELKEQDWGHQPC